MDAFDKCHVTILLQPFPAFACQGGSVRPAPLWVIQCRASNLPPSLLTTAPPSRGSENMDMDKMNFLPFYLTSHLDKQAKRPTGGPAHLLQPTG